MRRVLSMWQPWATLCVVPDPATGVPAKQWETRHWEPRYPIPMQIALHATQRFEGWLLNEPLVIDLHRRLGPIVMPRGAIIAIATVTRVWPVEELVPSDGIAEISELEFRLGDYSENRFAWRLEDVRALPEPIQFRGQQSALYPLFPEIETAIEKQLAGATI